MEQEPIDIAALPPNQGPTPAQVARKLSVERCITSLVHACTCRDNNCQLPSCQKMKRVAQHTKICNKKKNGGCLVCKQLIALCCYHAKKCTEPICPIPFCSNIKHKLQQQHRTIQIALVNIAGLPPNQGPTPTEEARKLLIERCTTSLTHAVCCLDNNCQLPSCHKMKRVAQHSKICKKKMTGDCPICKVLIAFCVYHGKNCSEPMCSVPLCTNIKSKLKQSNSSSQTDNAGSSTIILMASSRLPFDLKPVRKTKLWHQSSTPDLRNSRVKKIVKTLSSIRDPHALIDKRKHNLSAYARKIEVSLCEKANSLDEYYRLVDQKIQSIQMGIAIANSKPSAG